MLIDSPHAKMQLPVLGDRTVGRTFSLYQNDTLKIRMNILGDFLSMTQRQGTKLVQFQTAANPPSLLIYSCRNINVYEANVNELVMNAVRCPCPPPLSFQRGQNRKLYGKDLKCLKIFGSFKNKIILKKTWLLRKADLKIRMV